jgi:hypothetical protein
MGAYRFDTVSSRLFIMEGHRRPEATSGHPDVNLAIGSDGRAARTANGFMASTLCNEGGYDIHRVIRLTCKPSDTGWNAKATTRYSLTL